MGLTPVWKFTHFFNPSHIIKNNLYNIFYSIPYACLVWQHPPLGGRGPGPVWAGGGGQGGHCGGQRGLQVSYVAPILQ